ncbi:hypothetical protein [Lentibacillus sediminis]|nr:hypothetical protein [Lentibacillus sediminis]
MKKILLGSVVALGLTFSFTGLAGAADSVENVPCHVDCTKPTM